MLQTLVTWGNTKSHQHHINPDIGRTSETVWHAIVDNTLVVKVGYLEVNFLRRWLYCR
jgi:hypothetical protein